MNQNKLYDYIPKNTFISKYLEECENLETPKSYDFWSAVWIISLLINRQLYINRPNAKLYCNFFITLVGESGITRKSTALYYLNKTFTDITKNYCGDIINIDKISTDGNFSFNLSKYLSKINKSSNKIVVGFNIQDLLDLYKNKDFMRNLINLYDNLTERGNNDLRVYKDVSISNAYINFISACNTNSYIKALTKEEVETGFTSRNIICYEEKGKKKIPWGKEFSTTELIRYGRELIDRIKETGQLSISDDGIQRYSRWYLRRKYSNEYYTRIFESREQDFVLKLAGIFAINDLSFNITEKHIELAINFIKSIKDNTIKLLNNEENKENLDNYDKTINKIIKFIHNAGSNGIKHSVLYNSVKRYCTNSEFNYIINVMHELNMIEKLSVVNGKQLLYREGINLFKTDTNIIKSKML